MGRKLIDLTGQQFGRLTVLERAENRGQQPYWVCQCSCDKHTILTVRGSHLRNGMVKSCGCLRQEKNQKDLTNQRFGKLIALKPTTRRSATQVVWECQCDCGRICYVGAGNLINKHTQSCGCLKKENCSKTKDLTGQRFGKLTALEPTDQRDFSNIIWKCQCDCGKICYISSTRLLLKQTTSCGCLIRSAGEAYIEGLLKINNIPYETQKKFDSCKDIQILPFDFYVNNQYLIEFDGVQHEKPIEFFGGQESYNKLKRHDEIKNEWCKKNNIPLIRIPYNYLSKLKLEDLQLETSNFIVN